MALITAAWLHTPRGVEKGSCLNRPAKGVIVKSVENDVVVVMDYKKIHLHLHFMKGNNSPILMALTKEVPYLRCQDKKVSEKRAEIHQFLQQFPVHKN